MNPRTLEILGELEMITPDPINDLMNGSSHPKPSKPEQQQPQQQQPKLPSADGQTLEEWSKQA